MKDHKYGYFREELSNLINRLSLENGSNTADHVLAAYLVHCLQAFEIAKRASENLKAEPMSLREAASPTEEQCKCRYYLGERFAHKDCKISHQKEQPKWNTPTAEKITFNVWTGGGHEEHPEKPKGIEKLNLDARIFDGIAPEIVHLFDILVERQQEIIDTLSALTKSQ